MIKEKELNVKCPNCNIDFQFTEKKFWRSVFRDAFMVGVVVGIIVASIIYYFR